MTDPARLICGDALELEHRITHLESLIGKDCTYGNRPFKECPAFRENVSDLKDALALRRMADKETLV
jgi:hypothetical protein